MILRTQYCNDNSEEGKETMLFIILEDQGIEKMRVPLYLSEDAVKALPDLEVSFKEIPKLLQMIYNSGIKNEEIQFINEEVEI